MEPKSPEQAAQKAAAPLSYGGYLQLDTLLACQKLQTAEPALNAKGEAIAREPAHDELLFIITHQAYELWFKQILHELRAALAILNRAQVPEILLGKLVHHLERVVVIEKVLVDQMAILETMTPLDFLDFRDALGPSSGFQSYQFRAIENSLGLQRAQRLPYNSAPYESLMKPHEQQLATAPESGGNIFDALNDWLARTPYVQFKTTSAGATESYDFWRTLSSRVDEMLSGDAQTIRDSPLLNEAARAAQLTKLEITRDEFEALFNRERYETLRAKGLRRLSFEAFSAALMISLYRDEPMFQTPYRLLSALLDIDEGMIVWRHRHMLMVSRMIGAKIGTGGSSGVEYLRNTVSAHRIYGDLFDLSGYLIPRSKLPPLPLSLRAALDFQRLPQTPLSHE
jgi:tryptophan 2,3-dioxygenase